MSNRAPRTLLLLAFAVATCMFAAVASTAGAASGPTVTTIVSGLDNPRDLAFGSHGQLYVAEAGHGGSTCLGDGANATCVGFTSQISQIDVAHGTSHPVVTGIVSTAGPDGSAATGVDGISVFGDSIFGIITGSLLSVPDSTPLPHDILVAGKAQLGRLIQADTSGNWKSIADVGDADWNWTKTHQDLVPGQFPDANPYGVVAGPGEHWVVDAGSNTLDRVRSNGKVDVVAFFPNPPASDAVPTCIERGPDNALYIGELTGGGNAPGSSIVWRYSPWDGQLTQWATGLTAVTGCGFAPDGQFYAVEFSTLGLDDARPETGALVRVPAHSTAPVTVVGGLSFPGGFAASRDGALYFSDWSIAPASMGAGSVKRVILG